LRRWLFDPGVGKFFAALIGHAVVFIRSASATFELSNLPRLDIQFSNGKGAVDPQ
jgi:hypothetical protein